MLSPAWIMKGQGRPTYQLTTYPLKQDPSHPPDELVRNLLPDELM